MTSELFNFAARLRTLIAERAWSPVAAPEPRNEDSSYKSVFPDQLSAEGDDLRSDASFNALALELFALHFAHNAAYRKFAEARGVTPGLVSHWSQIPAVPAAAFKELELTWLPPAQRTRVFHSSGTMAQRPSRHFHNEVSLAVYEASLWSWFQPHVLSDLRSTAADWRLAILAPPPEQAPHSSLVHMFETVRRKVGAPPAALLGSTAGDGSWVLDFEAARRMLPGACQETSPLVVLGTAFSFVHLLDWLAEQNWQFQLPFGSRVMETGGYKGRSRSLPKAELHRLITERLGIPLSHIVCEYGMSELSSQAYDGLLDASRLTPHASHIFHFPPWSRARIISPETDREVADGETGLIRVFDLANVFSVMAIQTEDLGLRRGDGFELTGRAELAEPRGCSLLTT